MVVVGRGGDGVVLRKRETKGMEERKSFLRLEGAPSLGLQPPDGWANETPCPSSTQGMRGRARGAVVGVWVVEMGASGLKRWSEAKDPHPSWACSRRVERFGFHASLKSGTAKWKSWMTWVLCVCREWNA